MRQSTVLLLLTILSLVLGPTAYAAEGQAEIALDVVGPAGEALSGYRYVAAVPEDRPWNLPSHEALLEPGEPAPTWRLPAGRYGFVCAAEGHALRYLPPRDLGNGAPAWIPCAVDGTVASHGQVVDRESGAPIRGASTSLAGQFAEGSPGPLSPLGESLARHLLAADADDHGHFQLYGPAGYKYPVWVEAPGHAPALVADFAFAGGNGPATVALAPGGQLVVDVELPDGFPADRYRLSLRPLDVDWPMASRGNQTAMRSYMARQLWRRPLPTTGAGTVRWSSLPTGRFEVWLKGADQGGHRDLPLILGEVVVRAGATAQLRANLADWTPPADTPAVAEPLRAMVRGGSVPHGQDLEAVRWRRGASLDVHAASATVAGGALLTLGSDCRPGDVHVVTAGGRIGSAAVVDGPGACGASSVDLELVPFAGVHGTLDAPRGVARPTSGALLARDCGAGDDGAGRQQGSFPFLVGDDGSFRARVPATCRQLTLQTAGFSPIPWRNLNLQAGGDTHLGRHRLEHGAALLVRVLDGAGGSPMAGATVDLVPQDGVEEALDRSLRGEAAAAQHRDITDPRGWTRLAGLEPGSYVLQVGAPGEPVPVFTQPFALEAGIETHLDDVVLAAPATLTLAVEDPTGALGPGDSVRLDAFSDIASCGLRRLLSLEGKGGDTFDLPPLPSGSWQFAVSIDEGQGKFNTLGDLDLQLESGALMRETVVLTRSYFRGVVTLAGEPVEADLEFHAHDPQAAGYRPGVRTDSSGRFEIPLAAAGTYEVRIQDDASGYVTSVPSVELVDPAEEVEIELTEGRVDGRVEDASGRPIGGAIVVATREDYRGDDQSPTLVRTGSRAEGDGAYHLLALTPGRWTVKAWDKATDRRSEPRLVELTEGERILDLRLVVDAGEIVAGTVRSSGLPLPNAQGVVTPLAYADGVARSHPQFRTDGDGSFRVELPPGGGGAVNVVVQSAGSPVTAFRAASGDDLSFDLPRYGASVSFHLGPDSTRGDLGRLLLMNRRGATLPLQAIRDLLFQDGIAVVPNLAPGHWRLHRISSTPELHRLMRSGSTWQGPTLAEVQLAAGDVVDLDVQPRPVTAEGLH